MLFLYGCVCVLVQFIWHVSGIIPSLSAHSLEVVEKVGTVLGHPTAI